MVRSQMKLPILASFENPRNWQPWGHFPHGHRNAVSDCNVFIKNAKGKMDRGGGNSYFKGAVREHIS